MDTTKRTIGKDDTRNRRQINGRSNAIFLKIAGGPLRAYSKLTHVGRKSGRVYVTPLGAYPLGDGFVLALLYGDETNVDWCRNVMAADKCRLKTRGQEYVLENPEIIPASQALEAFPPLWRLMLKSRGIQRFVWLHKQQA